MFDRTLLVSAALLLAGSASAQTTIKIVPSLLANAEGPSSIRYPFSYETSRTQILYRTGALTRTTGLVTSLNFRREGYGSTVYGARAWNFKVEGSLTPVTPRAMTTTFANNRGPSPATLFQGVLSLPPLPQPPTPPAPFLAAVPLQQPIPIAVAQGNLLLEFIGQGPGYATMDYTLDAEYATNQAGARSNVIGMYCVGAGGETFKIYEDTASWVLGGKATVSWGIGSGNFQSILNWIGARADRWGPIKLPFDLAPLGGTSSTPDRCMLFTDWLGAQVILPSGSAQWGPIPNDPALEYVTVYTHALGPMAGANPLGVVMGPALSITIGSKNPPVGDLQTVYWMNDLSNRNGMFATTTGHFVGPVTEFHGVFN